MAEQQTKEISNENAPEPVDYTLPDYFLQNLIDLANRTGASFGVTLNVGGFVISGYLASGKDFFDGVAGEMKLAFGDNAETAEAVSQYFSSFGTIYVVPADSEDDDRRPPSFVHLREARYFHPSGKPIPGNRGLWWRGRVTAVSGFSMGNLSAE